MEIVSTLSTIFSKYLVKEIILVPVLSHTRMILYLGYLFNYVTQIMDTGKSNGEDIMLQYTYDKLIRL